MCLSCNVSISFRVFGSLLIVQHVHHEKAYELITSFIGFHCNDLTDVIPAISFWQMYTLLKFPFLGLY